MNVMTIRPEMFHKHFSCYRKSVQLSDRGRTMEVYDDEPFIKFTGIISQAKQNDVIKYQQQDHSVTHEIIASKRLPIRAGDMVVLGDRKFYVHGVRDPGELGLAFCIFTEERESSGRVNGSN